MMLGTYLETAWLEPSLWATWQQLPCHHWARTTLRTTEAGCGQVWCVLRPPCCPHVDWDWASGTSGQLELRGQQPHNQNINTTHHNNPTPHTLYLLISISISIHLYISTHYIKGLNKVSRWFLQNLLFDAYYYILELELSPEMVKLIYKDLYWQAV